MERERSFHPSPFHDEKADVIHEPHVTLELGRGWLRSSAHTRRRRGDRVRHPRRNEPDQRRATTPVKHRGGGCDLADWPAARSSYHSNLDFAAMCALLAAAPPFTFRWITFRAAYSSSL